MNGNSLASREWLAQMAKRDDTPRALLPPVGSHYSFDSLSEAETKALEEALGDGFGDRGAVGSRPLRLPPEIKSGLLQYSFFVPSYLSQSGHDEKYGYEESDDLFWMTGPEDQPAPFERLP